MKRFKKGDLVHIVLEDDDGFKGTRTNHEIAEFFETYQGKVTTVEHNGCVWIDHMYFIQLDLNNIHLVRKANHGLKG